MKVKYVSIFPGNVRSYLNNSIFDPQKKDDWSEIYIILKRALKQKNISINTCDIATSESPFRYIYFDLPYPWAAWTFPVWKLLLENKNTNILICQEPPNVLPFNYMKLFHIFFAKIYTWNDSLVDNRKYFKIRLPKMTNGINTKPKEFKKKKFVVLINSNKSLFLPFVLISSFGKDLYSERNKAIEFFEATVPQKFFLYGRGWNKPKKYSVLEKLFGFKKYSTYRGEIDNKIKVLSNFKYCICFENLTNVNGYITEKIIDCFKARCIPIYWGASNIEKYIPKNCFIDFRNFKDYKALLTYLDSIDEVQYNRYIQNIEKLLRNQQFIDTWFEKGYVKFFLTDVLAINNK